MWHLTVIFFCVILNGCQSTSFIPLRTNIDASKTLNASNSMNSLPVEVVVYQLSSIEQFRKSTFDALWLHDKQSLNNDLVSKKTLTVLPGEKRSIMLDIDNKTQFIGVVGFFRKPTNSWRYYIKCPYTLLTLAHPIQIQLNKNQIKII